MLPSVASAASVPVRIGDRDLLVSPLSDRDFDELSLWFQVRVLRTARACLESDAPRTEREEILKAAYARAAEIDFLSAYQTCSPTEQRLVLPDFIWRLLRKNAGFTLDDARRVVESGDGLKDIMDAWHLAQFGKLPAAKTEGPEKNAEAAAPAA